ncbi:hypothetical protein CBR_g49163 [Chara braunii]|uniref:Reverse transcriptase domain-containing protein n=1 Tax=Chara braunii TaxID=69332 RepID=A0A388K4V1_CHABU|nr:hypothetical protein CBR_g49163 [Chara braunii]|eukprot:GBG65088.1 hypothetical protein CBR_g49163 [Chara braunii]
MTAFLARLGTYMQQVQEEQQREAAAEEARLNAIAHAETQRRRQQVDEAANHNKARRDAASVLMQQEAAHIATLQAWNVDPVAATEPTMEEQTKSALANMMYQVILTCNWQQVGLARQARTITEHEETLKSLHARLDMLEKDNMPHRHTTSSSINPPIRKLEERLDHLVALVENLNSFRQPTTISQQISALQADLHQLQQQPTGTCNNVTPKFSIERFDDYHKADPISWWQGFTNELSIHLVPLESKISALYLCNTGANQVWLNHLAQTKGVEVSKLYTKITWEAMTEKWRKRFIVDDAQGKGVNRIFNMHQGSQPTREWLTEWQKIETIPNLDIPFVHLRREFFQRSVDSLSTALGERSLYTDFDQIVEKAREVIQTNRWAANERRSQPNFVEKGKGPRPQQVVAVQGNGQESDHVITHESSEGDGVNALPPRRNNNNKKKKVKSASTTEAGQPNGPWKKFNLTEEQYKLRRRWSCCYLCNNTKQTPPQCLDKGKEDNAGPLPRIGDILERLGGAQYFSKLDLKAGYHQLEIHPRDRYKTPFKTRYGHFEWVVMLFGLTNAPTTFQAAMTTEFRDMLDRFVFIYLDDILVYSRTLDEHIVHLRAVLDRLHTTKYKAHRAKCKFAQQEFEYLGHFVTPQGISPLADKIKAIQDWPKPTNTMEVRSFMGLVGYYQRFIGGYAWIAAPLSRLQSPQVPFQFTDEVRSSFHKLKTTLLLAPVLSIYDPTLPTRVTTNASGYDMGAVLEQHNGVDWHPVEYFSQKVPPINSVDDARKKQLLAFVTVLKRWQHFLLGRRRFTWVTDNNPLTYYKTQNMVSSTIARWMYFIDQFNFTPKHIPSLPNRAADALS